MSFDGNDDPSSAQPVSNSPELKPDGKSKPVSARKLAANRANAARSTGPRTAGGKARVRMNALRHGLASQAPLLPGEYADDLEALAEAYHDDLRPRGALEEDLVARIVSIAWRLRRIARAEEAMWEDDQAEADSSTTVAIAAREVYKIPNPPGFDPVRAFAPMSAGEFVARQFGTSEANSPLERLAIYEQRLGRSLHAAIRELNLLRKLRGAREDETDEDDVDEAAKTQAAVGSAPDDDATAQNKPTASDASQPIDSPKVDVAPDDAPTTSSDAPDGPGGRIEQNKPTARPGRFGDPEVFEGAFDVEREDTHPPSP
jgi:hypothetical protein